MTDIDLHHEFDRLDTGISEHPDLAGLWAGGQRRRRRTRLAWTAAGLATAAVVAPLALLVGGGATAPTAPGFASEPTAAPSDADPAADLTAVVTEYFPDAQPDASRPGAFSLANGVSLQVTSGPVPVCGDPSICTADDGFMFRNDRRVGYTRGYGGDDKPWIESDRPWTVTASSWPLETAERGGSWINVVAAVDVATEAEASALLPAPETLMDLAVDERLVPAAE